MISGTFHLGDPVSIKLTFDPASPPFGALADRAAYDFIRFDLTFGSYTASYLPDAGHTNFITIINNGSTGLGTADAFGATGFDPSTGVPVAGLLLESAFVSLFDFTQTVFSGLSLPSSLDIGDFQTMVAGLQFCTNSGCGIDANPSQVNATIDSLTVVGTAPEPATRELAMLSLVAAVFIRSLAGLKRPRLPGFSSYRRGM
jgi:hypothetical protein